MKIKLILLLAACDFCFAENTIIPETKEIIGSGIFDVNKDRKFTIDDASLIYLDNVLIDYPLFEIIGSGFKTSFTVTEDINESFSSGTINAIDLITNIKGPVTSISPLMVLEQPILITSDTVKSNLNSIQVGQLLTLSGYLNENNSLKSTKAIGNGSLDYWKVRGFASNVNTVTFKIGKLKINRGKEELINCEAGFTNNSHVEVKMSVDNTYQSGEIIETLLSIECLKLNLIDDETDNMPSVVQGFVSQTQGNSFWLNDIQVVTSNKTEYVNGEKQFIDTGVNVEVQGIFDPVESELVASVIRFIDHRIELTFPLNPGDVDLNESLTILGQNFKKTPQTKDGTDVLSLGISSEMQVQVQGFVDSDGTAYISKLLDKGIANHNEVSIRGDIDSINNPMLSILNVQIDVSNSTIVNQGTGVIDVETFFNLIELGSQIEIKNAIYDLGTNTMIDGLVTLKRIESTNLSAKNTKEIIGSGIIGGFATATISATPDQLFINSFEQ